MSIDFLSRIVGMFVFSLLGARLGVDISPGLGLPQEATAFIFSLVGILVGLVLTPWVTTRPIRLISRAITEKPIDNLFTSLVGLCVGLLVALLTAYPLAQIPAPLGGFLPTLVMVLAGYLGMTIFNLRAREILDIVAERTDRRRFINASSSRQLLLDTSVLIDGRIVDIAKTGFVGGVLVVPRFVLSELHQVADSSDVLRRNRGRRGLAKLNELQRDATIDFKIIEDDIDDMSKVDDKLVAMSIQMECPIVTNDFNLNRVAEAQGVTVLNINVLANAVRSVYIPGETFPIHIIQEGRENDQGVGYLEDGTMVVIEGGRNQIDRTVNVEVTKLINKETGRMIFAKPTNGM